MAPVRAWFLVLVVFSAACGSTRGGPVYTSVVNRYSVTLPLGWTIGESADPEVARFEWHRPDGAVSATLVVLGRSNTTRAGVAPPSVRAMLTDVERHGATAGRITGPYGVAGTQSELAVFDMPDPAGQPLRFAEVAFARGGRDFAITLAATPGIFDQRLAEYRAVLRSLRFAD